MFNNKYTIANTKQIENTNKQSPNNKLKHQNNPIKSKIVKVKLQKQQTRT